MFGLVKSMVKKWESSFLYIVTLQPLQIMATLLWFLGFLLLPDESPNNLLPVLG